MRKLKKYLSCLFVFAMVLGFLFPLQGKVQARENKEEMSLIYANVPADWTNPNIWAWAKDGKTAFDAWPGEQMNADKNNSGWYYMYVPKWANHVIINSGELQTKELELKEGNAWLTVKDKDNTEISTEQLTKGDLPEYVKTFKVHAKVEDSWKDPKIWAWSAPDGTNAFDKWPGKSMTKGEDGWYTASVPEWVNSIIVNGNDGDVKTPDVKVDPAELWITVKEDGTNELSYEDPAKANAPKIKVYVKAPADWKNPNLWAWSAPDGTNVFTTWPGEALKKDKNGWLVKEIPGWVNSLIVNGNKGKVQTKDISVEKGKNVWLVVDSKKSFKVYYKEPAIKDDASSNASSGKSNVAPVVAVVALLAIAGGAFALKKKKSA